MVNKNILRKTISVFGVVAVTQLIINLISKTFLIYNIKSVVSFTLLYALFLILSDRLKHRNK